MKKSLLSLLRLSMLAVMIAACSSPPTPLSYATDFDQAGAWTQIGNRQADIFIQDGQLHILVKQPETLAWSVAGLDVGDLVMEVEARPLEGPEDNGYGIIVRRVDDENLYSFQISSDGYFIIQKRIKGRWINLTGDWQESPAIQRGQATNRLRVTCKGSRLTFIVNDTLLAQVTDGDLARGDVGVVASTFAEAGVHIVFDNVQVQ